MSSPKPATLAANKAPSSQKPLYSTSQSSSPIVPDLYDPSKIHSLLQAVINQVNDLSRNVDSMNLRMDNVELRTRNIELQTSLDTALARIKEIEAAPRTTLPTTAVPETKETDMPRPPQITEALAPEPGSSAQIVALPEQCSTLSKPKKFNWDDPLSPPPGFQHIYLRYRGYQGRKKDADIRKRLSIIGVQNSRVVGITNADHSVIALLVHDEYAPTLISILAECKINPITDFPHCAKDISSYVNKTIHDCAKVTQKINYL